MKIGIQLFSVKEALKKDPKGTLKQIADLGYKYIEPFANPKIGDEKSYGLQMDLEEAKAYLAELGLKVAGAHYYPLGCDGFAGFCKYYAALGAKQVGSGGAHFPGGMPDVQAKCKLMNIDSKIAYAYGLKYYYHNHYREYQLVEGKQIIDVILESSDPKYVWYQMDNFWAARGGVDPVKEMERLGSRVLLLHQKDYSKDAGEPVNIFEKRVDINKPVTMEFDQTTRLLPLYAEVGTGILPIQDYIDAGNKIGVEYMFLEQDKTRMGEMESIAVSMKAFKKFKGIEWE
ncbi:MAG: hypothetical protein PHD67_03205 [Oscillospiraceae bacterium]|nr:hypothetical protein [Oscillospiraceae bacterium]